MDLQEKFLGSAKKEKKIVKVILIKGIPFTGIIEHYDKYSILINVDGKQHSIQKSAISTVVL
ncbi:RNA chaperone Hfq [Metabacillus fastidiosus]|uniref:RNA chaperone Hfq n=1 Tax=Metabacillus fastidiosus TaxID=1458 RepID=UPI002E2263F0|nr:RNA chaperone Hfq [Metabacillus fastidiosus]MED4456155.1 RNA chaperone Hfq [Metabacillus fastidiosus]